MSPEEEVLAYAIRHAHPLGEIWARLEAHGFAHLINQPALGSFPAVKARRLRRELARLEAEVRGG